MHNSLQSPDFVKTQTGVFQISGFLVNSLYLKIVTTKLGPVRKLEKEKYDHVKKIGR